MNLPVVALTLGDPAGIGAELVASLLADPARTVEANIVLVGDPWLWEFGQKVAARSVATMSISSFADARNRSHPRIPAFMSMETVARSAVTVGSANAAGGISVLSILDRCMDAAKAREIDAICFAPLNKQAMKLGGLVHEDELHHFADYLGVSGFFCEFNTLGELWTSRISSHVPFAEAVKYVTRERVEAAARLIYGSLQANGIAQPRVAVAALNPHGGDGGMCGREELDIIAPAVASLQAQGLNVQGPFPADTIFIKARDGAFDAVVTMYHDQGQIAIKLLGFSKGVTVQGGLPVPITTPAHGTAYDIAGQGKADPNAIAHALAIAARMGISYRDHRSLFGEAT